VMTVKLSEGEEEGGKRMDVLTAGGEVLVVPQATLGGKLKGNSLQYHHNVKPVEGAELYRVFCEELREGMGEQGVVMEEGMVKEGQYGARQVLSMETNGPYSHAFDI
jgi:D-tyrosyl-tRNA(Tyr) deacylase